ncbi:MAG: indolepyruvate ferredoxin oxidoreductase subunit alpha [Oscillospiraceae bacterium]|jgi:indolepyruvate ferredoxin oxidoreductase alpha subunit|nr:indolepyruvate ferredoxin oxidoreductase subunit alpha [Oscillospiraceae bacterium]
MDKLLLGNEAVAAGLLESGCRFVSSYPGTPSTEITERAAEYGFYCEWAPNEKVALEGAVAAAVAGARAFSGMKHVGLNVAADPLFTASYTGINGGLVVAVADDPGMHSSQNEQDSRHYALAAKLPMLEPADSEECRVYTKTAFELSERFDTPVLLRLSTRVSHSRSPATRGQPQDMPLREYKKDASKYVMMPAMARARHIAAEERMKALRDYCETTPLNGITWGSERKIGVVASGIAYQTAREALGDGVSYMKLGMVYPLPAESLRRFASQVDELWVIEELDDFIEAHCRQHGIKTRGKAELSPLGEYSVPQLRRAVFGADEDTARATPPVAVPGRPPALCPGCPHRGVFYVLAKRKVTVFGDIGCYTLAAAPPLSAMDYCLCMGASVSGLHGFLKARPEAAENSVAVIGDSTFMHSGITGLLNAVYNNSPVTVLILDNSTTGMTGHQQNPATGLTLKNEPAPALDIAALCAALGVRRVCGVDPYDMKAFGVVLARELAAPEPSVIIAKRPCVLLKHVKKGAFFTLDREKCSDCGLCLKLGCPALKKGEIDGTLCAGCGLCAAVCGRSAIVGRAL